MLKVLSYNIHKGVCYYTRQVVLAELRDGIRRLNPDLVFLQEVRGHSTESSIGPQFEFLADQIWPHFAYGKNATYSRGHHGNAILSKYPIHFHHNLDISTNRLEKRGLLHATVQVPKLGALHLFCLHLDLLERGRQLQIDNVVRRISSEVNNDAVILAGDFNDWRRKITSRLDQTLGLQEAGLLHLGHHARTFPSVRPTWCLDRIYFRGLKLHAFEVHRGGEWQNLSDHLAITATFKM